jgi:Protein of unknown function (DUF2726)
MEILLVLALCIAAVLFFAVSKKSEKPRQPQPRIDYAQQLTAVTRPGGTLRKKPIMRDDEFQLFRAAMTVTGQPMPSGFYVFPQVSLGEIMQNDPASGSEGQDAYNAINCKRCDLLLTDRRGFPVAVLEYQGSGHGIGSTAGQRDDIKRQALERAGVRYREVREGTTPDEMRQIIRQLLTVAAPGV